MHHLLSTDWPGKSPPPLSAHTGVDVLAAIAAIYIGILIHECGHALAARLLGHRVTVVRIGAGRTWVCRLRGVEWRFGLIPQGGQTNYRFTPRPATKMTVGLTTIAGPLSNLILALAAFQFVLHPTLVSEALAVFGTVQLLIVIDDLLIRPPGPLTEIGSDGWKLRYLSRAGSPGSQPLPSTSAK